jgi:hypothetical protein
MSNLPNTILSQLLYTGTVRLKTFFQLLVFTTVVTILLQIVSVHFMRRSKLFWAYLILEKNLRYAYNFIQNRNDCADIYSNGIFGFFAMLYLETHNSLTPKLLEGYLHEKYSLVEFVTVSVRETRQYLFSYLFIIGAQKYWMGCPIAVNWPIDSLLFSKQFISGYCHITFES